ncbi:MAG: GspH/FimT family pseudopilin [Xanthomonadales bacterium]|nr:GspH/FimT family pseudopilin [Xanthomonadales bacterium]
MQKTQGFTLIELLITIAIMAIMMAMAVPSFKQMVERNQVTTTGNDMIASIMLARSTAVTREGDIRLRRLSNWNSGWTVRDAANNVILRHETSHPNLLITAVGSNTTNFITYTAQGRTSPALAAGADYFKISLGNTVRCINFSTTGRPSTGDCPS